MLRGGIEELFYVGVELSTIRWLTALRVMDMPILA